MRLAAVYFPAGVLKTIFGENHSSKLLNFGGKNLYDFKEKGSELTIFIERENPDYIPGFWSESVSLITAIAGANGVGKTTILRAINQESDAQAKDRVLIFEQDAIEETILVDSSIENRIRTEGNLRLDEEKLGIQDYMQLYYSPAIDYDLKDARSPIGLVGHFYSTIEQYFLDSVSRNVNFLGDPVINKIKEVYQDFPVYELLSCRNKKFDKDFFTTPYAQANFATPHTGEVLQNEIDRDIRNLTGEKGSLRSTDEIVEMLKGYKSLLRSESFTEQFNKFWTLPEYAEDNDQGKVPFSKDFLKNLEINLISFILLGAVFPQTGLGSSYPIERILEEKSFEGKLDRFLEYYLINRYKSLYDGIKADLKDNVQVKQASNIIAIIEKDPMGKIMGIEVEGVREAMIKDVHGFSTILRFYEFLKRGFNEDAINLNGNVEIIWNIANGDHENFQEFLSQYSKVLDFFSKLPVQVQLFDIYPSKRLSYGEKALLDFYSSLHSYFKAAWNHRNPPNSLIFLLDEPELGYHPLWKKKFINALVNTLPLILRNHKKRINIQVLFTTHDPLTLSDLPNNNIVYLDKSIIGTSIIESNIEKKTFGANVTDLLSESFFIKDGLLGDFAKEKIQEVIDAINNIEVVPSQEKQSEYWRVINMIDEPLLRNKIEDMFLRRFLEDSNEFLSEKILLDLAAKSGRKIKLE